MRQTQSSWRPVAVQRSDETAVRKAGGGGLSRRRFLSVAAAVAGAGAFDLAVGRGAGAAEALVWQGTTLGASAKIRLQGPNRAAAKASLASALAEIRRLERLFSLYRRDSVLVQLNRTGKIEAPPFDLVRLMGRAQAISRVTGGAFDPTVQPLWELYANHFAHSPDDDRGPPKSALVAALARVDYRHVRVDSNQISFERPGMAITLNGIAQGYITDRVVAILRRDGFEHFIADLGEPRAVGSHPSGRPWRVRMEAPGQEHEMMREVDIIDRAVATSAPQGTRFEKTGKFHHLFDTRNGGCASLYNSVSVIAPTATLADGLSTAFAVLGRGEIDQIAAQFSDVQWFVN